MSGNKDKKDPQTGADDKQTVVGSEVVEDSKSETVTETTEVAEGVDGAEAKQPDEKPATPRKPQGRGGSAKSKKTKDEDTAEKMWARTVSGVPTRYRAGEKFTREWAEVDCALLSADQEKFIRDDKKLEVSDTKPAAMKDAG